MVNLIFDDSEYALREGGFQLKLKDKVAIVTGGANGIGRAIAVAFAREGAKVVVDDIDIKAAEEVVNEINVLGGEAIAIRADVTKSKEVNQMVKTALDRFGKIDILVNNAGGSAREKATLFQDSTEEVWDFVIGLNLKGTMLCTRAVINHMLQHGSGRIINIASPVGTLGESMVVDYSAAKGGVIAFTKALAREVSSQGITVNCVSPGVIRTKVQKTMLKEKQEEMSEKILLGRIGEPEEIAPAVVLLASDDGGYTTGANWVICGGAFIS